MNQMWNLGALQVLCLSILPSPSMCLRLGPECLVIGISATLVVGSLGVDVGKVVVDEVVVAVAAAFLAVK